jgi:hypothetical protein
MGKNESIRGAAEKKEEKVEEEDMGMGGLFDF